ncbi:hypothetical protein BJ741DRAFT_618258 [Chytriomyces cf. hyalinus JEL632]|nr:hypothetical protein BJ741DRAFT_618258 [Chytriomyces cf. hyalinus JEL632]
MISTATLYACSIILAVASVVSAQAPSAASLSFPSLCATQCSAFGAALTAKCVTSATTVQETSQKIGLCFCTQYAAAGGVDCLTCIGNSYPDKNATDLFKTLGTDCSQDGTGAQVGASIAPVIRDAVLQNAVSTATTTASVAAVTTTAKNGAARVANGGGGAESVAAVTPSAKSGGSRFSVANAVVFGIAVVYALLV